MATNGGRGNDTHTTTWPLDERRAGAPDAQGGTVPDGAEGGLPAAKNTAPGTWGVVVAAEQSTKKKEAPGMRVEQEEEDAPMVSVVTPLPPPMSDTDGDEAETMARALAEGSTEEARGEGGPAGSSAGGRTSEEYPPGVCASGGVSPQSAGHRAALVSASGRGRRTTAAPDGIGSRPRMGGDDGGGGAAAGDDGAEVWKGRRMEDDEAQPTGAFKMHTVPGNRYHEVYGDVPAQDATLEMLCQTAELGGYIFGDNMTDTAVHSEEGVRASQDDAYHVRIIIQVLFGACNTSKLHRLMIHVGDELRIRGSFWEGDTSVNDELHKSCKMMYKRTNRRGPGGALQLMRCDNALSEVLQEAADEDSEKEDTGKDGADDDRDPPPNGSMALSIPTRSGRGQRHTFAELKDRPGLQ